jgi:hypothetical protein
MIFFFFFFVFILHNSKLMNLQTIKFKIAKIMFVELAGIIVWHYFSRIRIS